MEFFTKSKAVRLRSHLDKYLIADENEESVRQSRKGSSPRAKWVVEFVEGNNHLIRLKSCYGKYLTATEKPFLLGMTGKRVLQTHQSIKSFDSSIQWEPIRDGFQVKLRTGEGKFLRANGATPPWRNSVTHDVPNRSSTHNWVLWDVDMVDLTDNDRPFSDYQSQLSSSVSSLSEDLIDSPTSPWSTMVSPKLSSSQLGMELFRNAKAIRLKSHHEKYLLAEEDEESVCQDRNGSSKTARWTVEFIQDGNFLRFKSCFGKYLTASNLPFLLGMTGRKVLQTLPKRLDSSVEWEPVREGFQVKLKTRYGNFLRANGGLPPWRNSITHDIPHRTATQDWVLWDVDILEITVKPIPQSVPAAPKIQVQETKNQVQEPKNQVQEQKNLVQEQKKQPGSPPKSSKLSKLESSDSFDEPSLPVRVDGRIIYYSVADENGDYDDDGIKGPCFTFKGNGVDELTKKLEKETGLEDIIACTVSNINGKLYPLRLQLPPNNTTMHVVVVQASSRVARDFMKPGLL